MKKTISFLLVCSMLLPMTLITSSAVSSIFPGDKLDGDYIKYQYIYNVGPDPNMYWFHTFFTFKDNNGNRIGGDCHATYSPEKPGDRFQD